GSFDLEPFGGGRRSARSIPLHQDLRAEIIERWEARQARIARDLGAWSFVLERKRVCRRCAAGGEACRWQRCASLEAARVMYPAPLTGGGASFPSLRPSPGWGATDASPALPAFLCAHHRPSWASARLRDGASGGHASDAANAWRR